MTDSGAVLRIAQSRHLPDHPDTYAVWNVPMPRLNLTRLGAGLAAAALVLLLPSCSSGGGGGTTGGGGVISLSLSSSSGSVAPGGQAVVVASVTKGGGFTGDVAIAVSGVPAGVTGGVGTISTVGTTSTAIVTILVATTTTPGSYPITVQASGSGVSTVSATYTLTVSATAQSYTLSVAPTSASVAAGSNTTATVNINRSGFGGSVNLSVPNLPAGFTAVFAPNNTAGNSSTLTVTVAASVAPGLYQLTIGGVASGQQDQLTFFAVTVPATGSYALSVSPATVTVAQGSSNTATVTITRSGGFSGNVGLTATGNPALVGVSFSPSLVSGTTSVVTLNAVSTQPTGTYTVTIHGAASGFSSEQTATLSVTVTAAGGGGGGSGNVVLNWSACPSTLQPIWLAYQDGSGGPWTVVNGSNHVYQFSVSQAKVGYAAVMQPSGTQYQINVVYYTNTELTSAPIVNCPATGTNSMTGTVAGVGAVQQAQIEMDDAGTSIITSSPGYPAYTLEKMFSGSYDLLGWLTNSTGASATDKIIIRRGVQVMNGGAIPVLDFGSSEAFSPTPGTITVNGANGAALTAEMVYYLTGCHGALTYFEFNQTSPFTAYGVPAAKQQATDFHSLTVGAQIGNTILGATEVFHTFGNRTIALPTAMSTPAISVLSGNYRRLQAMFTIPSDYNGGASFIYYDANAVHDISVTATEGYLGGNSATLAVPSFSGLSGFMDSWAPATGSASNWIVQTSGSNFTGGNACQEGGRLVTDNVTGSN